MLVSLSGVIKVFSAVLKGDWSGVWDGVKTILRGSLQSMVGILRGLYPAFLSAAAGIGDGIKNKIKQSLSNTVKAVRDGMERVKNRVRAAVAPVREAANRVGDGVTNGLKSMGRAVSYVRNRVDAVIDVIRNRVGQAKSAAGRVAKGIIDGFDRVRDVITKVKNAISDAITAVKDKVGDAATAAGAVEKKIVDAFGQLGNKIKTAILGGLAGLAGDIARAVKGAIGTALKSIGNIKNKIKSKIPGIGGASASTSGVGIGGGAGVSANAADTGGIGMDAGVSAAGVGGGLPISMSTTASIAKKKKKKIDVEGDRNNVKTHRKQARWYDKQIAAAKTETAKVVKISAAITDFTETLALYPQKKYPQSVNYLKSLIKKYQGMLDAVLAKKPAGPPPPEDADNDGKNDVTGELPTVWKAAQAGIALAELTPDTADDTAAKNTALGLANTYLNTAKSKNDYDAIVQWAAEVKQLTDAVQENTQSQQVTNELLAQQLAESKASYNVSQAQSSTITAALLDIISGGIGGTIGLGFQTPAYAGKVASY